MRTQLSAWPEQKWAVSHSELEDAAAPAGLWVLGSGCHVDLEPGSPAITESQVPDPGQLSPSYRREEELQALLFL